MSELDKAIEVLEGYRQNNSNFDVETAEAIDKVVSKIEELRKECTLKRVDDNWIVYECSNCKDEFVLTDRTPDDNNINYCQNCGARVIEVIEIEEDEEDEEEIIGG